MIVASIVFTTVLLIAVGRRADGMGLRQLLFVALVTIAEVLMIVYALYNIEPPQV
jgi:hypothetical protein